MGLAVDALSFDGATDYHYGQFPPKDIDYARLVKKISSASAALARYDGVLRSLHNSQLLLGPLRRKEAVISSRIEGTIATLDEVLKYEAEEEDENTDIELLRNYRHETIEVFSYSRALNFAQREMINGLPICSRLIASTHSKLLFFGRGADKQPGHFKTDQNYVIDKGRRQVLFVPIKPSELNTGLYKLEMFINSNNYEPLVQTALAHLEFEALHPFKDGNGRVGRMLITLMLWDRKLITAPHFYISGHLEQRRDEYIDRMRNASAHGLWTDWCEFFLEAVEAQAEENLITAERIRRLYDEMKDEFRTTLSSKWSTVALDYVFERPVFKNNHFTAASGIPAPSAFKIPPALVNRGLLNLIEPAAGRRPAVYGFEPLLRIVRA